MNRIALVLVAAIALSGCAAKVMATSPRSVLIDANSQSMGEVQKMADAECAKHGRYARLINPPRFGSNEYLFDCVQ